MAGKNVQTFKGLDAELSCEFAVFSYTDNTLRECIRYILIRLECHLLILPQPPRDQRNM